MIIEVSCDGSSERVERQTPSVSVVGVVVGVGVSSLLEEVVDELFR